MRAQPNAALGGNEGSGMTLPRVLSVLTGLLALYAAWRLSQLIGAVDVPGIASLVDRDLVIVVTGIFGSIRLWRDLWVGYLGAAIAWVTTLVTGVTLGVGEAYSPTFVTIDAFVSIPILVLLFVAIRRKQRAWST